MTGAGHFIPALPFYTQVVPKGAFCQGTFCNIQTYHGDISYPLLQPLISRCILFDNYTITTKTKHDTKFSQNVSCKHPGRVRGRLSKALPYFTRSRAVGFGSRRGFTTPEFAHTFYIQTTWEHPATSHNNYQNRKKKAGG